MLKKIGLFLLGVIGLVLISGIFIPTNQHFEKKIIINATAETIWPEISTFKQREAWSPWKMHDPKMKTSLDGLDGKVGTKFSWESEHERVGWGSQTITKLERPNTFISKMNFIKPHEGEGSSFMNINQKGRSSEVVWGFDFEIPYPFNAVMALMPNDDSVDQDFENGLAKLKEICEK